MEPGLTSSKQQEFKSSRNNDIICLSEQKQVGTFLHQSAVLLGERDKAVKDLRVERDKGRDREGH